MFSRLRMLRTVTRTLLGPTISSPARHRRGRRHIAWWAKACSPPPSAMSRTKYVRLYFFLSGILYLQMRSA